MKKTGILMLFMLVAALLAGAMLIDGGETAVAQEDEGPGLIVYASDSSGNYEIYTLDPQTGDLEQVTDDPGADIQPMWSPSGEQIVFASDRDGDFEIYVMNADGTDVEQLTRNDFDDVQPSWQPEADFIIFASDINGNWDLYAVSTDGTVVRQLTNDEFDERGPGFAMDEEEGPENVIDEPGAEPVVQPTATQVPAQPDATVDVPRLNMRSNPGEGADILTVLAQDDPLEVIGRRFDNSWLQVRTANGLVGWIYAPLVNVTVALGDVPVVDAPFIAPPTPTPTVIPATNTPVAPATSISFTADRTTINSGECVTLSWDVAGIREVYYQGTGVTGQGSAQECPGSTSTYNLHVVLNDGTIDDRYITITVN